MTSGGPRESLWADGQVEVGQVEFFLDALERVRLDLALADHVHQLTEQCLHTHMHAHTHVSTGSQTTVEKQ